MMRVALGVEYNGQMFHGWQRQAHCFTVQEAMERALASIAQEKITLHSSGRTDAGVHGLNQVVHFDTHADRPLKAWKLGVNTYISRQFDGGCSVRWAKFVPDEFHARFSTVSRRYRYKIYNRSTRSALNRGWATHCHYPLDAEKMHQAAQLLLGTHDFDSYRTVACQAHSPVRTILDISVVRDNDIVSLEIEANGFLHHMVRNIAGVLLAIGKGERPVQWAKEVLDYRDRTKGGLTAPPDGLYFLDAQYPAEFEIPNRFDIEAMDTAFGKGE